jgi:uncharacterized protein YjbI with pentapeptide repeats
LPRRRPQRERWDGAPEISDGLACLDAISVDGVTIELSEAPDWELLDSELINCVFGSSTGAEVSLVDCDLVDCDLSRVRLSNVRGCRLVGCKLAGADLSGRPLRDTIVERCALTYTNLRMCAIERVRFDDCALHDTDFFEADLKNVSFAGSALEQVCFDRTRFLAADLRETTELDLTGALDLTGCLIDEPQVFMMAHMLARRTGLTIAASPTDLESP